MHGASTAVRTMVRDAALYAVSHREEEVRTGGTGKVPQGSKGPPFAHATARHMLVAARARSGTTFT